MKECINCKKVVRDSDKNTKTISKYLNKHNQSTINNNLNNNDSNVCSIISNIKE